MNEATYGASIATARSRLGGVSTVKPWLCNSDATAFQLEPSAHAPWTRTIVGFGIFVSRTQLVALGLFAVAYRHLGLGQQSQKEPLRPRARRASTSSLLPPGIAAAATSAATRPGIPLS